MPIVVTCPECDAKIKAPEHAIGKMIKCPKCSGKFTATANSGAAPAPTPPPAPPPPPPAPDQDTVHDDSSGFGDIEVPPVKAPAAPKPAPKGNDDFDDMPMPPKKKRGPASFGDFLTFKAFITPTFGIQIVFWVIVAYSMYFGFGLLQFGIDVMDHSFGQGIKVIGLAMLQIVLAPIFTRVMCETIVVFFRINESIGEVQDDTQGIRRKP
jgi:hypothetical protein